jgi:cell division protein FtsI (penicillin-binding protein 3)
MKRRTQQAARKSMLARIGDICESAVGRNVPDDVDAVRLMIVVMSFIVVFAVILLKCMSVQIVGADDILARGAWRADSHREVSGSRGDILDRNGVPFAQSVNTATLAFDPQLFFTTSPARAPEVIAILSEVEGIDVSPLETFASQNVSELPQYRVLARHLNPALADEVVERLRQIGVRRGVWVEPSFRRIYGQGDLAATTVGLSAQDGSRGISGVEMQWDEALAGRMVRLEVTRDHLRRAYQMEAPHALAEARGQDVVLTLDARLQRFAQNALQETIDQYQAQSGVVIVSRVHTGEILALATAPNFDLNSAFRDGNIVWQNAAVSLRYEPGSTAKIFTFAAAFDAGVLEYDTPVDCGNGSARVGRFLIRDTHRMGIVPAWQAMQHSSNVGALRIGRRMDQQTHYEALRRFGFGDTYGLMNEEVSGTLRPPPWAESVHATISYGHGMTVTPLQLNMATAAIANGGELMRPMLVRERRLADGTVVSAFSPEVIHRAVSERAAELTTRALITVTGPDGTGRRARVPGYEVAGKTGTARLVGENGYGSNYMASFTGFFPAHAPEFAVTVMVVRPDPEIGYYGGVVAAPLFSRVAEQTLALNGYLVGQEEGAERERIDNAPMQPAGTEALDDSAIDDVEVDAVQEQFTPDLNGHWMTDALRSASSRSMSLLVHGSGRVVRQEPPAWAPLPANGTIEVWLESAAGTLAGGVDEVGAP